MYVLVHHRVTDPDRFWPTAQNAIPNLPPELKLHHTFPARDGEIATCLWEADSVEAVREFLEPALGEFSSNTYAPAENREGIAVPPRYAAAAAG
jgi:hypothetical protein